MPSIDKGITLTFAKKNFDVRDLLKEKKKSGIVLTDYICNSIRFFEENKNNINNSLDLAKVEKLIEEKIKESLKNIEEISVTDESIKRNIFNLESDIDEIDDDEIEDD